MPTTTRQLAKIANVSEQTVRNYTRDFGELLSPQARGDAGTRLFSDEDVQIFCTIANLRKQNVPPDEVIARLKSGDIVIDVSAPQQATQNDAQQATTSPQTALTTIDVQPMLLARFEAIERRLDAKARGEMLWHIGTGIWIGIVFSGFVLWVLWLVVGY